MIFSTNRQYFCHKPTWIFQERNLSTRNRSYDPPHRHPILSTTISRVCMWKYSTVRSDNFKVWWRNKYYKKYLLFYSIIFCSILFYYLLYYFNNVRWRNIKLSPSGFELTTSCARRTRVFLRLFAGFDVYRLFVFIFQFIFHIFVHWKCSVYLWEIFSAQKYDLENKYK